MPLPASVLLTRLTTRVKLRHMQALIALNDLRSIGRAAESIGMTQPAMSQLLSDLEKLLETQLFLRHSKGVEPTAATLEIIPSAQRIIQAAQESAERIAANQRRSAGLVRLASTPAADGGMLDEVLPQFASDFPNIQVQVTPVVGSQLDAAFSSGEYDAICARRRSVLPDGWEFVPCVSDALVPICGSGHPLAQQDFVTKDQLQKSLWLQHHLSTVARQEFDLFVAREGWTSVKEIQVHSRVANLVWSMLRRNDCVSLVPRSVVQPWLSEGNLIELSSDLVIDLPELGYIWRPETVGLATRSFVRALKRLSDPDQ